MCTYCNAKSCNIECNHKLSFWGEGGFAVIKRSIFQLGLKTNVREMERLFCQVLLRTAARFPIAGQLAFCPEPPIMPVTLQ